MSQTTNTALKVGLLFFICFILIGVLSVKISKGPGLIGGVKKYVFMVDNASGIIKNSSVKMAGVRIGIVEDIRLIEGKAEIVIRVSKRVRVDRSTTVELKSNGLLGDRFVSLLSGGGSEDVLKSGDKITNIYSGGSMNQVMSEIGGVTKALKDVADALRTAAVAGDQSTPIGRIVKNIETLSADMAEISQANKGKLSNILDRLDSLIGGLSVAMDNNPEEQMTTAWQNIQSSLEKLDQSMTNIEDATEKINSGQGTIGKLINDETTVNKVNEALDGVNDLLGGARAMEFSFDYHSEYLFDQSEVANFVGLRLQPGQDRFYEFGIVQDSFGSDETKTITTTTDDGTPSVVEETTNYDGSFRINALLGKTFYGLTVKGGLIQGSGGLGLGYKLIDRRLKVHFEAFDFDDVRLRAFAKYQPIRGLYLIGGGDSRNGKWDSFLGGGIQISTDDLKILAVQGATAFR